MFSKSKLQVLSMCLTTMSRNFLRFKTKSFDEDVNQSFISNTFVLVCDLR